MKLNTHYNSVYINNVKFLRLDLQTDAPRPYLSQCKVTFQISIPEK